MNTTAQNIRGRIPARLIGALIGAAALLALAAPASALAAPVVEVESTHIPAGSVPVGTYAKFEFTARNTGDADTTGDVTVEFTVPTGLEVLEVRPETAEVFGPTPLWICSTPDTQTARCVGPDFGFGHVPIEPGKEACEEASLFEGFLFLPRCRFTVLVKVDENAPQGTLTPTIHASGGGSVDFNSTAPIEIGPPPQFELTSFDGRVLDEHGDPATAAGSHPDSASTEFSLSTRLAGNGAVDAVEQLKDAVVKLPSGLVGNPTAIPTCTQAQLAVILGFDDIHGLMTDCPTESQLGVVTVHATARRAGGDFSMAVYNMERPDGSAAVPIGTPASSPST